MRVLLILLAAIVTLVSAPVRAEPDRLASRAADAVAAMEGKAAPQEVFSSEFLKAVPQAQLMRLASDLQAANGKLTGFDALVSIAPTVARFRLRFERATAVASMQIESAAPHRIVGFRIASVTPIGDTPAKIVSDFAALKHGGGFAVTRLTGDGTMPALAHRADEQFAIGSAFKLWVLEALAEDIETGRLRWDQAVPLGPPSLPSGQTQDWPKSSPVTVHSLAVLMIAISDNTATDTLIGLIGRERIEARLAATGHSQPGSMRPFLTTAEAFGLKADAGQIAGAYARASDADKRKLLSTLPKGWPPGPERNAVTAAMASEKPMAIDAVEWFASPNDVVRVLDALRRRADPRVREILAVAPHLPEHVKSRFAYAGYKGGSEPGVLNLSWLIETETGAWYAVTASWNNTAAPLNNADLEALALRLIALVR